MGNKTNIGKWEHGERNKDWIEKIDDSSLLMDLESSKFDITHSILSSINQGRDSILSQ